MDFSSFANALTQLSQGIEAGSSAERSHLSQLADLQAKLDALKIEARAKAGALREQGQQPITITIEIGTQAVTAQPKPSFQAEVDTARKDFSRKAQQYRTQLKDG
ncbi:MAG: hypothetical protein ACR2FS_05910 [Phormidesmis sp.]